jgi:hypothetical protein
MAEMKIEVPIVIKGADNLKSAATDMAKKFLNSVRNLKNSVFGSGGGGEQREVSFNIKKMAAQVGILAAIWAGLEPLLRPVLQMLRLLLIILFLPLMPIMKDIAKKIGEVAKQVKAGQGGETGAEGFLGGLTAFIPESFWGKAGLLLATGFLLALTPGRLAKVFALGLAGVLTFDAITGEGMSLENLLFDFIGISGGVFALTRLAGIGGLIGFVASIGIGLSIVLSIFSFKTLKEGILEGSLLKELVGIIGFGFAGALVGGLIGSVVPGLGTAVGAGIGFLIGVSIGLIIDMFIRRKEGMPTGGAMPGLGFGAGNVFGLLLMNLLKGKQEVETPMSIPVDMSFNEAEKSVSNFQSIALPFLTTLTLGISNVGFMIGSKTKGSYPLVFSLNQASIEWVKMRDISIGAVNEIINRLNSIPRRIVTTHVIRTVRE